MAKYELQNLIYKALILFEIFSYCSYKKLNLSQLYIINNLAFKCVKLS